VLSDNTLPMFRDNVLVPKHVKDCCIISQKSTDLNHNESSEYKCLKFYQKFSFTQKCDISAVMFKTFSLYIWIRTKPHHINFYSCGEVENNAYNKSVVLIINLKCVCGSGSR
jgi:hypothetical protein